MNQSTTKAAKKKGIIRWEAILPFVIFCTVIGIYFTLFFDAHLRKGLEWAGYNAVGSEVNIGSLKTSFWSASLDIRDIELTDAEKPTHNSVKIGDIRFSMLWDALLRAKVVINEAAIEQIEFGNKRSQTGKVKPPEPPSTEPSAAEKELAKIKAEALAEAQGKTSDNVLGDIIALIGGTDAQTQLDQMQAKLPSKAMLAKFEADLKAKQVEWDAKLKALPQEKQVNALRDRLGKIKSQNFKNVQEVQTSLAEFDKVYKDGDAMYKEVEGTAKDLQKDLQNLQHQYKQVEAQVKTDIKTLEQHFRLPTLDPKAMTMAVFNRYLAPYKSKFFRYKEMADKYLPPNLKNKKEDDETVLQPHPRVTGVTYEFGRLNAYPLFWMKRAGISSQAGTSPDAGNIAGELLNVTSNQKVTGKPTVANISGDFPGKEINGILMELSLDNTQEMSEVLYKLAVKSYPIIGKELVSSPDVSIAFTKASGSLDIGGKLVGLKQVALTLKNSIQNIDYQISSKNEVADQILKSVFAGIPVVTLSVSGEGLFPHIPLSINSNLGPELQKGFQREIQAKIDEARNKIQAAIDAEIGKQKENIDRQLKALEGQYKNEIVKVQNQLNDQKKQIDTRVAQAKKDAENQGKKALEKEGQKAVDDLKKKFGF